MRDRAIRWGRTLLAAAACLAVVALLGYLAHRPAVVFGIDANALAHSVRSEAGGNEREANCSEADGGWRCSVSSDGLRAEYVVEVDGKGCWDATRTPGPAPKRGKPPRNEGAGGEQGEGSKGEKTGRASNGPPEQTSGCIGVFDYIRIV